MGVLVDTRHVPYLSEDLDVKTWLLEESHSVPSFDLLVGTLHSGFLEDQLVVIECLGVQPVIGCVQTQELVVEVDHLLLHGRFYY